MKKFQQNLNNLNYYYFLNIFFFLFFVEINLTTLKNKYIKKERKKTKNLRKENKTLKFIYLFI